VIMTAPRYGARKIDRRAEREIQRDRTGEEPHRYVWQSPEQAVRSYVRARIEHDEIRSSSDYEAKANRVQCALDPSRGGREHAEVDRHRNVALALDRAECALGPGLLLFVPSSALALEAYVLRVVGKPAYRRTRQGNRNRKGRYVEWRGLRVVDVVDVMREQYSVTITEHQVSMLVRHFNGRVRDALVAAEELRPSARAEDEIEGQHRNTRAWDPLARLKEAT